MDAFADRPAGDPPPAIPRRARGVVLRILLVTAIVAGVIMLAPMERLFFMPSSGATPTGSGPPGTRSLRFESADGTRLSAWFVPASGPLASVPGPAVLHLHGNAGNILGHAWFTEHLPPAGFHLLILDYRGYGESEGSPRRREELLADAKAALAALRAQPEVDSARIGLYGQSLGGALSIALAAEEPAVRAVLLESPFCCWQLVAANALGGDPPGVFARAIARLLIRDDLAPRDLIGAIAAPILLLHGDADRIVPVSHSRELLAAAGRAEVELVELDGGDHNDLRASHPEVDAIGVEFLRRSLRPGTS